MPAHLCHWASCRTTCSSDQALFEHLLQDHGRPWQNRDVERLACQWAGCKTRPNRAHLPDHLISHTDYRPLVCNVSPSCTMRFKTRRALNIHLGNVKNHLPQTAPCEWKACTETLADPPALLEHVSKVHSSNGAEDICLWTECAHRSALKWKLDSCLPSWYELILSKADERGKTSVLHAHMNTASVGTKKRKRKGGSRKDSAATKGDADGEHKVERAPVLAQDEPDSESDDIAYVDDLKDADYSPGRQMPRRGARRQRTDDSTIGDQGDDEEVALKRTRAAKRLKVPMGEAENESHPPSLSSTSASASSPAVVTPEHEQDCASTTIATVDERLAAAAFRIKTLEAQLAVACSVIRQSEVLRAEWASRMSESPDDAVMILNQDPQTTTMEDELSPDDWSLWVTGAL